MQARALFCRERGGAMSGVNCRRGREWGEIHGVMIGAKRQPVIYFAMTCIYFATTRFHLARLASPRLASPYLPPRIPGHVLEDLEDGNEKRPHGDRTERGGGGAAVGPGDDAGAAGIIPPGCNYTGGRDVGDVLEDLLGPVEGEEYEEHDGAEIVRGDRHSVAVLVGGSGNASLVGGSENEDPDGKVDGTLDDGEV